MRRTVMAGALLLWSAAAFSQNLNPTVEVTNVYAREASGIEKPSQLLSVPDSLTRFNLDFDYAVNETPYQGAYEFTPYLVEPRPSARLSSERKFLLRMGAGFTLHPEFALVWTPVKTQKFRLNLFADHHSYIGEYHDITLSAGEFVPGGSVWKGSEMRSAAGLDALLNWSRGIFRADVSYNNVSASAAQGAMMHHVLRSTVRVGNIPGTTKVDYGVGTRAAVIWAPVGLQEIHTVTDASLRAKLFRRTFAMGLEAETVTQPAGTVGSFHVTLPRYVYEGKRFSFAAGVKAAFLLRSDATLAPRKGGYLFPDVQASWLLARDYLSLYLSVTGGNELMSYDSFLQKDSFIAGAHWNTDVSVHRVKAVMGFRGNIGHRFHYDLRGGYAWVENLCLWAFHPGTYNPAVSYAGPSHMVFGLLDAGWKNQFLDIGGRLKYTYTLNDPIYQTATMVPFALPAFEGAAWAFYNWGSRLRVGATLAGRSAMNSTLAALPGYLDLGFQGSFRLTPQMDLWLKLGNLLNQAVQRVPFYAEKGACFTAGFSLNL